MENNGNQDEGVRGSNFQTHFGYSRGYALSPIGYFTWVSPGKNFYEGNNYHACRADGFDRAAHCKHLENRTFREGRLCSVPTSRVPRTIAVNVFIMSSWDGLTMSTMNTERFFGLATEGQPRPQV